MWIGELCIIPFKSIRISRVSRPNILSHPIFSSKCLKAKKNPRFCVEFALRNSEKRRNATGRSRSATALRFFAFLLK